MTWVGVGVGGATIIGGMMSANAAGDAADQQSASSREAMMMQQAAIEQMRKDLSPWTQAGGAAQSALNRYLGIGGVGSSGVTSMGLATGLSPDQVRQQLMSRFTTTGGTGGGSPQYASGQAAIDALGPAGAYAYFSDPKNTAPAAGSNGIPYGPGQGPGYWEPDGTHSGGEGGTPGQRWVSTAGAQGGSSVDEEGLNAAIAKYYEEQDAQNAALQSDPQYGSLLRAYRNGAEFDSGPAFSFTGKDLASDPGYKFGLDQGTQGIERGQASRGNFLSGAAMKELTRFNEDYAGTKFNDAFSRNLSSYTTNLNRRQNEWNTNLGAYNQNRNSIYDFLTGVSRTGQNSAAQVGTSNNRAAESAGNYLTNAGTAQSAATIAGSNALVGGINAGVNAYTSGNSLNSAAGWNTMLANNNYGRSGNNYNGSSNNPSAANYVNQYD